ncbi:hypothetical protein ACSN7O_004723 [Enterobacter chuandaensis]
MISPPVWRFFFPFQPPFRHAFYFQLPGLFSLFQPEARAPRKKTSFPHFPDRALPFLGSVWIWEIIVRLVHYLTNRIRNELIWHQWLSLLSYRPFGIAFRLSD